ncbi:cellular tumor antigen p53-like isoform X3 [Eriocheir sinensis]|uniref:cellular tumor antigen p53-like isoform X3 n=1 Tax=Eriocheir sinensis TaxID=95602 RepID=UPI0021C94D16|nr:cellular tumor antigen p53-like isoform X3 [Eriocheir sinensis]
MCENELLSTLYGDSGPPPPVTGAAHWAALEVLVHEQEKGGRESVEMAPRVNTEEEWKRLSPPSEHLPSHFMEEDALSPQCSSITEALEKYNHLRSPSPSPPPTSTFVAVLASKLPRGSVLLDGSEESADDPTDDHTMVIATQAVTLPQENGYYASPVPLTTGQSQLIVSQSSPLQGGVSGMVDVPTLIDMEGKHGFSVSVDDKERSTKSPMWLMSNIVNKLYTNLNKAVPFEVRMKNPPKGNVKLFIRAVVVFSSPEFLRTNVTRCPNHAAPTEATNHDFPYPNHVVRADHPAAHYQQSQSGRLSVVVPLDLQQSSPDYVLILLRFMCLGSCVGGISRRPISIVITLENGQAEVLGRKVIDVRVCACPTRDIKTDEQAVSNKGVKRKGSSTQPPQVIRKKAKTVEPRPELSEGSQEVFNIKVHGRQLYTFMMDMMRVYYSTHPDYAQQHPDPSLIPCSSQRQKNSSHAKEKINRTEQGEGSNNGSEKSGSNSPIHEGNLVIDSQESSPHSPPTSQVQHQQGSAPTTVNLMVMNRETNGIDSSVKSNPQTVTVAYPTPSSIPLLTTSTHSTPQVVRIFPSQTTAKPLVGTHSDAVSSSNGSLSRHVPVMQVTREPLLRRGNLDSKIGTVKQSRASLKNSSLKLTGTTTTTATMSSGMDAVSQEEERASPGSKEMLAANVLAERFA